jgi:hypothetical protein
VPSPIEELNVSAFEHAPRLSADGQTIIWTSGRPGGVGGWDMWQARREPASGLFIGAVNLALLNSPENEISGSLSTDGLELFFASRRLGGKGGYDVWVSRRVRVEDPWPEPVAVVELNSTGDDVYPFITAEGKTLYYNRNTDHSGGGNAEIWVARRECL